MLVMHMQGDTRLEDDWVPDQDQRSLEEIEEATRANEAKARCDGRFCTFKHAWPKGLEGASLWNHSGAAAAKAARGRYARPSCCCPRPKVSGPLHGHASDRAGTC